MRELAVIGYWYEIVPTCKHITVDFILSFAVNLMEVPYKKDKNLHATLFLTHTINEVVLTYNKLMSVLHATEADKIITVRFWRAS